MHVHVFALDGQTFLKEEEQKISQVSVAGVRLKQSKQLLEGREKGRGTLPPTDSLCVKARDMGV